MGDVPDGWMLEFDGTASYIYKAVGWDSMRIFKVFEANFCAFWV